MQTQTQLLTDLHQRLSTLGENLTLDQNALGSIALAQQLRTLLGSSFPTIGNAMLSTPDGAGNFTLTGTTSWLQFTGVQVEIRFFVSHDTTQTPEDAVQCIVQPSTVMSSWYLANDYPNLPGYVDFSPQAIANGLQSSFLKLIDFQHVSFVFSSYDFMSETGLAPTSSSSYAGAKQFAGEVMSAGTHFSASFPAVGDVWSTVQLVVGNLSTLNIIGHITQQDSDLLLTLEYPLLAASLQLNETLALTLRTLIIQSGLTATSSINPNFTIMAQISNPDFPFDLIIGLDIGSTEIALTGSFADGKLLTLADMIGLLGIKALDLTQFLPDNTGETYFGSLGLQNISFAMTISPLNVETIAFTITTAKPWVIIDNKVQVTPALLFNITDPFTSPQTTLAIAGLWVLGTTTFDFYASLVDGDILAQMSAGQSLDVSTLFQQLLPDVALPSVTLVDLVFRANYKARTFYMEIEATDNWVFDLGFTTLEISDLRMTADYNGQKIDAWGFTGLFALAQLNLQITAAYDQTAGWSFNGGLPSDEGINLGTLFHRLLADFQNLADISLPANIPDSFANLTIASLYVAYQSQGKQLTLYADITNLLQISDVFSIDTFAVQLVFDANGLNSGCIMSQITVVGIELLFQTQKQPGQTSWLFQGGTVPGQSIPIGHLIDDVATKFGAVKLPAPLASLTITKLDVAFHTDGSSFTFTCETKLAVADTPVDIILTIAVVKDQKTNVYTKQFGGSITIGTLQFKLLFSQDATVTSFVATYSHTGDQRSVKLKELIAALSTKLADEVPDSLSLDLQDVKFVFLQNNQTKQFALGFDLGAVISLSNLPLIGDKLPADSMFSVNKLQFVYASQLLTKEQIAIINPLLPSGLPGFAQDGVGQGISFGADIQLGQTVEHLALGVPPTQQQQTPMVVSSQSVAVSGGASSAEIKWFDVQRSFGPAHFNRIGVQFKDGVLWFLLDASLTVGVVAVQLNGLGIGSPIDKFDPQFHLDGMGVSYNSPPLLVEGAFLVVPPEQLGGLDFEYEGGVAISAADFAFAAIGAYAQVHGVPSMFIFAELDKELGGPAFFFVTGLMGGFGLNRKLRIPEQNEVYKFPFVAGLTNSSAVGGSGASLLAILDILDGRGTDSKGNPNVPWITTVLGEYWVAIGVQWTSFELIQARALAVIEFGQDLIIAIIGLATMKLPQIGPESFTYVELQLELVFNVNEGFFRLTAVLSPNSYVLDPNCKLTGGFAFYMWFKGDHAGDFVVTLGGYHPSFIAPAHYPVEPRLGFNWPISDVITIHGEAYFALTPSMAMGGGLLDIRFNGGDLQAWFTARADFLIQWNPFYFTGEIAVSLGASYKLNLLVSTVTIKVELGASLEIWGPRIGGNVHVDWYIISFAVSFGEPKRMPDSNPDWSVVASLLPEPQSINKITVSSGLVDTTNGIWIVRADEFVFATQSAIPCNQLFLGDSTTPHTDVSGDWKLDIRPLNRTGLISRHHVALSRISSSTQVMTSSVESANIVAADVTGEPIDLTGWSPVTPVQSVAEAIWGPPVDGQLRAPAANLLPNRLQGYMLSVPDADQGQTAGPFPVERLSFASLPAGKLAVTPTVQPETQHIPQESLTSVQSIIDTLTTQVSARTSAHDALKKLQHVDVANGALSQLHDQANTLFRDPPLLVIQ
jgi:hypothetical protein